jgi:hypothetical protein
MGEGSQGAAAAHEHSEIDIFSYQADDVGGRP